MLNSKLPLLTVEEPKATPFLNPFTLFEPSLVNIKCCQLSKTRSFPADSVNVYFEPPNLNSIVVTVFSLKKLAFELISPNAKALVNEAGFAQKEKVKSLL